MKKLAAVLAFIMTGFVVTPALVAPAHAADDYTASVETSCNIDVPAVVRAETRPRIEITVRPNAPAPAAGARAAAARAAQPSGTVELNVTKGGTSIFSKTVPYRGRPVTVVGPVVTQPGQYVVRATFRTADNTVFKSCHNNAAFNVRAGVGPDDIDPDPDPGNLNPDGLLPDTGGPNQLWLILGLLLVGAGAGLVYAAKRQPPTPLYDV